MDSMISVIVPIFNTADYLENCIKSIINQTYTNLEIILVDDGSDDGSVLICKEYARKDKRIKVIEQEHGGVASARNNGLAMARGKYIGFVDSDDYINPTMYEELIGVMQKYNCPMSKCLLKKTFYLPNTKKLRGDDKLLLLSLGEVSVCNSLYKRELIVNIRFREGVSYEDTIFTFSVLRKIDSVAILNKKLYYYCSHINTTTSSPVKKLDLYKFKIYEEIDEYFINNCNNRKKVVKYLDKGKKISLFDLVIKIANYGYDTSLAPKEINELISNVSALYKFCYIRVLLFTGLSWKKKVQILLFSISPKLYLYLKKEYYLRNKRNVK